MGRDRFYSLDSLSGIFALVVDGEEDRRALLSGVLSYCGALVTRAASPDAALAVMELLKPDVVVVELTLPDDGSLRFIRDMRALKPEDGGVVATIAVGDGGSNAELARSRGFDAYLNRPLDPWELCRVITALLIK